MRRGWSSGIRFPERRSTCARRCRKICRKRSWSPPAPTFRWPTSIRWNSLDSTTSPDAVASPTLLFRVGASLYGCDIADAREIIPLRPATRLPGAPAFVRGLINIRGTIVTVMDLGLRLDPKRGPTKAGSILVVRHNDRVVGLIVDRVEDVRALTTI